jgi:hypothetical protein
LTRQKWKTVTLAAVASLGLSACSIPVAISEAQTTFGGSQFLQVHLTATLASADPASTNFAKALQDLTFDFNEQSLTGLPIKSSLNQVNQELVVSSGTSRVATFLEHKSNIYFNINLATLSHVPGVTISAATLASLNLLLGERWIELPFPLIARYAHSSASLTLTRSSISSNENLLLNAVVSVLAEGTTTSTTQGFSQTGSLTTLVDALATGLKTLGSSIKPATKDLGTYGVSVTMSGTQATGATLTVVTPQAKYGRAIVHVFATFAHQAVSVETPTYPLVITPTLIKQLGSNGGGALGGSLG